MGKLSAALRARTATVKQPNRKGGQKNRFPLPDAQQGGEKQAVDHARMALAMLPRAKGLSAAEKAKIRAKAEAILAKHRGKGKRKRGRHAAPAMAQQQ